VIGRFRAGIGRFRPGIGLQIALAAVASASVAIGILAVGVWVIGGQSFAELMGSHGEDAAEAHEMFDQAVLGVLILAVAVAVGAATVLAAILGGRLARPMRDIGAAARQIAEGGYQARLPRSGPEELLSLTDSFNQMAAALEEQERMRREFIANAAHELRTPLTNLQGYLEALRDGVVEPDRDTFVSLWDEADRLVRLSRSLDQLAAGDAGIADHNPVELDLGDAVRAALDLVRPAAQSASIELATDVPRPVPVRADADRLSQVLSNLLTNAIRYTPAGGRVMVRAERRPDDVLVSVVNTGSGIPAADLPHVFERFYRVEKSRDRARGGAGIGLSIVQQLVEAGGGHVGAESAEGSTRFWFTLPV
jgi:two-component system sensor histidine kinase BaeS